jgi:ATP-binding protein involved in chromosome partitioning
MTTGDSTPASTEVRELTSDAISVALGEISLSAIDQSRPLGEAVQHLRVCGSRVRVQLALQVSSASELRAIEAAVAERLHSLGATAVEVDIRRPQLSAAAGLHVARDPRAGRVRLPSVRHVLAVGAGKGGAGRSTLAINLALALAREGLRAGLWDADIYGPSLPILLGIEGGAAHARLTDDRRIVPTEAFGLPLVSFGFFLGDGSPAIWRGPMVAKAVRQFARGVMWPDLDVLIVDLPPGTGDVPLSLAQAIELSGAVIVTQPTRVAIAEARKAVQMFATLGVPVLGLVENMTGPFGAGARRVVCTELGVPFLGDVPFDPEVVREGDAGTPTMAARPGSRVAASIDRITQRVAEALGWRRVTSTPRASTHDTSEPGAP